MSLTERIYGKETAGKPAVSSDTQKNLYTAAANKKPSLANRIAKNGGQPTLYDDAAAKQKPSLASRIEANGGTPYADAAAKAKQSGTQNLYAQAAENAKKSGTNNSFIHGIAGIFEKAAAGAKEGLRTGLNEISYRAQAAAPLNAADDAYYKVMWEQTTGEKTGVEVPKDTRTQEQKELDEFMGVGALYSDSARAMQRAAEKGYERLDEEGLKTAFKRDGTYQEKVDQKYADLGPKWQKAMGVAGSVGNQTIPIIGRIVGTALGGQKAGEALQSFLFFNQASGAAIEEAINAGASWDDALTYGTVIGGIEAATELAGDLAGKAVIKAAGKTLPKEQFTKALIGTLTNNKAIRTTLTILGQMNGEGLEEVASDLVSPFAKSIYNGKKPGQNWMDEVTLQGLWESYLGGAISGGILSGVGGAVNGQFRAQNQMYADATVNTALQEARASAKENGIFNSQTREKIIDAGLEIQNLEANQRTAAAEAQKHMQMVREAQKAMRGDAGARARLLKMAERNYTAETQNAPVGAQRAQNEGIGTTPAAAINIQEGMNNGQSTYHREESGAAYVGSRGQAAEGTEGGLQALTGGRTEVQRGVGADAQADLRQVTPAQLGIRDGGTEAVTVVDAQRIGGEAKSAYDAVLENGLEPVAVRGAIQVNNGYANAYTESGRVFFRVDAVDSRGNAISPEALVRHEMFHNYASEEVIRATDEKIRENMTNEEYVAMREAYKADYAMVYDFANMSVDEIERLLTEEIAADAYAGLNWFSGNATVQEAIRAETERNAPARRAEAQQETTGPPEGRAQAFVGYDAETGRGIYRSNFEDNTPKAKKSERVIRLIQDVWSKNPIDLVVENEDGSKSVIKAEFDPRFDEGENTRSDAAKLAAGNRHGTAGEKRVTLNLADDFYRIIQESTYSGSKAETGKKSDTHAGVNMWRYFVNPILYMERSGDETTPYTVSIDVKQKDNGNFVYSFHAERDAKNNGQPAPQTLHAAVNGAENDTANGLPTDSIRSTYGNSQEKSSGKASVEVSGINNRTAAELRREYERRMQEYQKATQRDDPNFPYIAEMKWIQAAERRLAELGDGKHRRRTVGSTKRDIMQLFSTDRANRTDVERVLNRNIGEMMAQGEIRGDALDTLVNELLQTGSVVSSSKNSPWIDKTYESIRSDLKGGKLYVSKDMWRDFSKDEARELRERAKSAGITLSDNRRYTPPDVRNMELAEKYGEALFPTDISAPDMLRNIIYCAEQGANEKQTLADRLWDEARQEGLGAAREEAYSRMVNDLRDKTEVILREFAEDNHLKLKEQTKAEAKSVSYFDTKKAPVKEYSRRKGDYRPINNLGEYTREIVEMESALETKDAYIIEQGENRFRVKIEEDSGRFYAAVYRNGEMVASSSAASRGRLPHWAATEIRKNIGEQISFSPALENRGESYNADLKAAEEAGYPVFEKKNGEKVQTVPFWTWVRNKERGNYGIVIAQTNKTDSDGNRIVEVYYYNKQKDTGKVVGESAETVYAVDGKYSDPNEVEKSAARMKDEESEAMRAEEREALWRETQKGSPFEAQPNATTDTRERVTKATSAGVQRLFQQLISKGKTEVSTQVESGIRTYTAKMNTNGVEYWVDISDGRQDVQRFREFEKEKAAQLAAEWMDKEANRAYTAANEKRAEARRAELSAEENAKIAELFGNTEELKTAETPEDAPSPGETAESRVTDEIVKAEKSFRESLADVTHGAMRMFVNAGETVRRISKQTKNKSLEGYYFNAGAYSQRAGNWIAKGGARTDISGHKTGESLMDILGDIMKTPEKYKDFQLMLLHRNNVDRMRYDNKEEVQNLTKCVTTIEDLYPKLRGLDNDYLFQTAVPGDKRDMLSREWKETVLDELLSGEMPEIADISEAAQMLIFTRQKISEAKKNGLKPVFGYEVTAYDSQLEAERLLKANPEFDDLAKRVYAYFDDLLQYRIDAGLDTQKHVDAMKKRYPNYVPTMRVEGTEGKAARRARRNGGIVVSNAIGRAVGGDAVIMPLHTAMSRKTVAVMKNAGLNQFGEQLVQSWNKDKSIPGVNKVEMVDYSSTDQYVDSEELYVPVTNNVFSVLRGNDRYNITMDEGLAQAMNAFQPDKYANSDVAKLLKKGNDLFKALCTGYNPIFMVRNLVRDAQDAAFYSTDSATWAKMFPSAWKQIVTNGEIWQQYKALGGSYASMLDYTTGMVKEPKNALGKAAARYESLGQAIEAAPRLAEFMTILANKGGSKTANGVKTGQFTQSDLMEAMLGAADITTNFARGGTVTKMLNKYLVPFLNPSVQGADKFVRNITDRKGFKAWASLAIKAAALGILPELLNGLLYRDDDEWDDIPDQTKSNYYLFKLGDGYWMKIPRGRALAVFSAGATYAQEKAKGNDPKFSDVIEVVKSNVAPTDIFNQNIATAWTQTKLFNPDNPGTTWYGGNIESERLQNYRPGERYDEKTDEISKWIGKTFNLSPKKINYLLDQYSGVVGDLLLPWFTPSATASSPALAPLKQAFMLDSTSTNKTTGEYYDLLDDLKYDANDGDIGAGITRKYVSHAGDEVNDYYQQIRAIQSDENLTKAEKNRLVRALKSQLIERQKEIIAQAEPYREAVSDYLKAHPELSTDNDAAIAEYAELYGITEDQAESRMDAIVYREANREVFGAEYALRTYNADVYDKARATYAKGVSYETYYDYYFATKEMHADKDENGKSISGSKKAKVVEYINSLDIPPEQKDALYVAAGYTAKSARNQKWNGGSGGSGGRRGRGKRTALKAPTPKAPEIIIPRTGTASSAKAGGTSKAPKVSGNVIADFTKTASGTDIQKAVTQAKRKAIKAGNRTLYVEEGSPIDYFLKYGKLPSLK